MKKFTELPLMGQLAIFAIVAVIIGAAGEFYYPDLQSMATLNATKKAKLEKQIAENNTVRPYEQKFKEIQVENKQLEIQLGNLNNVLPADRDADGFIKMVHDAGALSGVGIRRFTAGALGTKETYMEMPFELELDGKFSDVLQFFDKLARLPRVVNVTNLAMGPVAGSVRGVRRKYQDNPSATVAASCLATTFFRRETPPPGKGGPPAPGKK